MLRLLLLLSVTFYLSGCTGHSSHKKIEADVQDKVTTFKRANNITPLEEPAVVRLTRPEVNLSPISEAFDPPWFSESFQTTASLPFGLLVRNAFEKAGVVINFDNDLDQNRIISVIYEGTLRGLLDELSLASGYAYTINHNRVDWHKLMTKTLDISLLPGNATHTFGPAEGVETSDDEQASTVVSAGLTDNTSQITAEMKMWDDLQNIVEQVLSEDGKAYVSQASSTLTVRDYPSNVRQVENVVERLLKRMRQQVMIHMAIISIEHDTSRSDALDWNIIRSKTTGQIDFGGVTNSVFNQAPLTLSFTKLGGGIFAGSNILLKAIEEQAQAAMTLEPRVITLHNQISEMHVTTDQFYLASSTTTITDGVSQTTMEDGVVTDGLTVHLLPSIDPLRQEITLDMTSTISEAEISEVVSNGSTMQTPTVAKRRVKNRARLKSGETMLISGLERLISKVNENKKFNTSHLGAKDSEQKKIETLVLVTPVIME